MRDVVFVGIVVAFFALAALYVRACALIAGSDEIVSSSTSDGEDEAVVGAENR